MTPWDTALPLPRPNQARFLLYLIAARVTHAELRGPGQPSLSPQLNTHPVHLQGELGDDRACRVGVFDLCMASVVKSTALESVAQVPLAHTRCGWPLW